MNQEAFDVRTEQWRRIVRECINRDPMISKRQWCRENSIRYRSLMYWQQKFQRETFAVINDHGNSLPVQSGSVNAPAFADMTARLETLRTEQCPPAEQETLMPEPELMIQAGSYRIYVGRRRLFPRHHMLRAGRSPERDPGSYSICQAELRTGYD